jgi:hypothetical protein
MGSSPIPLAGTAVGTPGQPSPMQPGEWVPSASPALVSFKRRSVEPPGELYVQTGEILAVSLNSNDGTAETITVVVRLLLAEPPTTGQPDGTGRAELPPGGTLSSSIITVPAHPGAVAADGTPARAAYIQQLVMTVTSIIGAPTYAKLPLQEGFLLSVGVVAAVAVQRGNSFVRIWLQKAAVVGTTLSAAMPLVADYVTQYHPIGFPNSRTLSPTEGPGMIYEINLANPGAGNDWTYSLPVNNRMRVQSIAAVFSASAAVANRIIRVQTKNILGGITYQAAATLVITANQAALVAIAPGQVTTTLDAGTINIALPTPILLYGVQTICVSTLGLQATDAWSGIHMDTEIWVDGI